MKKLKNLLSMLITLFVVLMILYPLYMKQGFVHLATAKKEFYYIAACVCLLPSLAISLGLYLYGRKPAKTHAKKRAMQVQPSPVLLPTDFFVLAYLAVLVISTLLSRYPDTALNGSDGWYMGLWSQLLFLLSYLMISRHFQFEDSWLYGLFGVSAVIFLLCVLARFHVAPFGLYDGRDEAFWNAYIPTIGQKNWYACFLVIVFPIMLGYFLINDQQKKNLFLVPLLILGSMAMVMQDSDSIYVGMLFVLLFLFEMFCNDLAGLKKFFLMLVICLASIQVLGLLQICFREQMVSLSATVTAVGQGLPVRLLSLTVLLIWILLEILSRHIPEERQSVINRRIVFFKRFMIILAAATVLGLILLIILVTNFHDTFDFGTLSNSKYFLFDEKWGTYRGMNWMNAVESYRELNLAQKLFGIGPDCYYPYANEYHAAFAARWSSAICNAHNEFLTALVNTGLLGAVCYYGIFLTSIRQAMYAAKKKPVLLALSAGIAGFLFNNLFSFMNIISTPLLFLVVGWVAALCRPADRNNS